MPLIILIRKMPNNNGPTIEPCGTPVLINYIDNV